MAVLTNPSQRPTSGSPATSNRWSDLAFMESPGANRARKSVVLGVKNKRGETREVTPAAP